MKNVILISTVLFLGLVTTFTFQNWRFEKPIQKPQTETPKKIAAAAAPIEKPRIQLREAVLQQRNQIETCYDEYLRREPKRASGSISVTWTVGEKGNVIEPEISSSTLHDEDLKKCVLTRIGEMTFEPDSFATNAQISYKFNFKARSPSSLHFE